MVFFLSSALPLALSTSMKAQFHRSDGGNATFEDLVVAAKFQGQVVAAQPSKIWQWCPMKVATAGSGAATIARGHGGDGGA